MIVATYNTRRHYGGAAKAAFRLHSALRANGMHAYHLCLSDPSTDPSCVRLLERETEVSRRIATLKKFWSTMAYRALVTENRTELSSTLFSIEPFGLDVTEAPVSTIARVHHLHWCKGFLSPAVVKYLRATGKPIFVTLHDQWWMTGGCHYAANCTNYEDGCVTCPQLRTDVGGLVALAHTEKAAVFKDATTVIAPSRWMADCAKRSIVFRNADIRVVRNPIDVDVYSPLSGESRAQMRAEMGLQQDEVAILFGADSITEPRKGFSELIDALKLANARTHRPLRLIAFGCWRGDTPSVPGISMISVDEVKHEQSLAQIYSSADLLVVPSREDNYPNTIVESLACGTPVIGFSTGGIVDLVDNNSTGLLADVGNVSQLADAIIAGIDRYVGSTSARARCRETVAEAHRPENIARQMISIYAEKSEGFHKPLSEDELSIVTATSQKNRMGEATFARLNMSPTILNASSVVEALAPLFSTYDNLERNMTWLQRQLVTARKAKQRTKQSAPPSLRARIMGKLRSLAGRARRRLKRLILSQ